MIDFTFYSEEANMSVEASLQRNEEDARIVVQAELTKQGHYMCRAEVHNNTNLTSQLSDSVYFKVVGECDIGSPSLRQHIIMSP